jgi:lipopolysaccharide/colanic/teichoic acid biosynthesis glycosyltransferase
MAKRLFDIVVGGAALLLLTPVMVAVAGTVFASVGSPILFRQRRSGLGGRDFVLFKFRTMRDMRDENGVPLSDEQRVTRVGRLLRRTRLDELPELVLVIAGKMSLVGPRPLPGETLESYGVTDVRSRVRPGLTGLAQVSGNTLLSNEEKFAIDALYTTGHTLLGDLGILLATLRTVALGERRNEVVIQEALSQCARY